MVKYPTSFSQISGHEDVKKGLTSMLNKKAVGHALLFVGPEGVGKSLMAWALTAQLLSQEAGEERHAHKVSLGQHPDVHVYRPEGKLGLHSIQSMRQLSEAVHLPPYEAKWKVFIIQDAERMLTYSANALLKTFEEPPAQTLIILISQSYTALLPTIISRCRTVRFSTLSASTIAHLLSQNYQLENSLSLQYADRAQGSMGRAIHLMSYQGNELRLCCLQLLAHPPSGNYRHLQQSVQEMAEKIEGTKKQIEQEMKDGWTKTVLDSLTSQHQHAIQKEIEGFSSVSMAQETHHLLEVILSWYRDLQVLLAGNHPSYLINKDFYLDLEQAIQRGEFLPLDVVSQMINEAQFALQRSTALSICLETLFLKLGKVS